MVNYGKPSREPRECQGGGVDGVRDVHVGYWAHGIETESSVPVAQLVQRRIVEERGNWSRSAGQGKMDPS